MPLSTDELLGYITSVPASATAIAKKAGFSKAASIQDALDELVESGKVIRDDSGRFPVYSVNTAVTVAKNTTKTTRITNMDNSNVGDEESEGSQYDGYYAVRSTNKSGQTGKKITLPSGKKVFVKDGSCLMVINDVPCYTVSTPEAVIKGIIDWTKKNGLSTFVVEQIGLGSVYGPGDVKMTTIINLSITAVNKAA